MNETNSSFPSEAPQALLKEEVGRLVVRNLAAIFVRLLLSLFQSLPCRRKIRFKWGVADNTVETIADWDRWIGLSLKDGEKIFLEEVCPPESVES